MTVELLDSTLREGELFRIFPRETKVRLARELVKAGIRRIEMTVDYPPRTSLEDNVAVIREIEGSGALVVMHGRASADDIEAVTRYDVGGCAFYIAISRLHRELKLHGISAEEAVQRLADAVRLAKEKGFRYIRATLEDASRVFLEEGEEGMRTLEFAIDRLSRAGATLVSLPDTSGLLSPRLAGEFFRKVKGFSILPVAAHFHNDYGFASANTVEAALEGANELHVTIMGIGDRNGIADLYQVAATLEDIHGIKLGIDRSSLRELYSEFSRVTGIRVPWVHPLSDEARTIRAGVHQAMTVRDHGGYIPARKMVHDFDRPLYVLTPYISSRFIQELIASHGQSVDPRLAREIAELLATVSQGKGRASQLQELKRIVREKLGVHLSKEQLTKYFGGEIAYILLKLDPKFQASQILQEAVAWDGVESVDEVYGDVDVVIRAKLEYSEDNLMAKLRQKFPDAIRELKILVTE